MLKGKEIESESQVCNWTTGYILLQWTEIRNKEENALKVVVMGMHTSWNTWTGISVKDWEYTLQLQREFGWDLTVIYL